MKSLILLMTALLMSACSDSTRESEQSSQGGATEFDSTEFENVVEPHESSIPQPEQPDAGLEPTTALSNMPETMSGSSSAGNGDTALSTQEAAELEAQILKSTRALSDTQATQSERVSIDELADLSAADRQALRDKSAQDTAKASEEKAERQAAAAALQSID